MKKFFCFFSVLLLFAITGCGEKTCAKWEIKPAQLENCSGYNTYQKIYCELQNEKKTETRTCVEWK